MIGRASVWSCVVLAAACAVPSEELSLDPRHAAPASLRDGYPRLLITSADIEPLRARAAMSPWREMREQAIATSRSRQVDSSAPPEDQYWQIADVIGAAALAYIVDPDNAEDHIAAIVRVIERWFDLVHTLDANDWSRTVPPGTGFFDSVLALDIIHDAIDAGQLAYLESALEPVYTWYASRGTAWGLNLLGARGIWAAYRGDEGALESAATAYRDIWLYSLTPDGVFPGGANYGGFRMAGGSHAKAYFLDVLERNDEGGEFYSDPEIASFFEWLYGYSVTPTRRFWCFGDTSPIGVAHWQGEPGSYRAHLFSERAARYAAWLNDGRPPRGHLLDYVLTDRPPLEPEVPQSRIFPAGGAFFREAGTSPDAVASALWSPSIEYDEHVHHEANAVAMTAYGETVLRNSGYNGWGSPAHGFGYWGWISDNAESGNTVTVDGANHATHQSGGVPRGFTSRGLDWAEGDSGPALGEARHRRAMVLVHGTADVSGYSFLLDAIDRAGSAQLHLHPNSPEDPWMDVEGAYTWRIRPPVRDGEHDVGLTVFFGTPTTGVSVRDGVLAAWGDSFVGRFVTAEFAGLSAGRSILTVLFPFDEAHPRPSLARIGGAGYTGARIDHASGASDVVLESNGIDEVVHEGLVVQARALMLRQRAGAPLLLFVEDARRLGAPGLEVSTTAPVTLHLDGPSGTIASSGADVTFEQAGLRSVWVDGIPSMADSPGRATVAVPGGVHSVELSTEDRPFVPDASIGEDAGTLVPDGAVRRDGGMRSVLADGASVEPEERILGTCACAAAGSRQVPPVHMVSVLAVIAAVLRRGGNA